MQGTEPDLLKAVNLLKVIRLKHMNTYDMQMWWYRKVRLVLRNKGRRLWSCKTVSNV
jgi:hypothetical protein